MVLRVTVDEQQRRSGTTMAQTDGGAARPYIEVPEAREVRRHRRRTPTRWINAIVSLGRDGNNLARNIWHGSDPIVAYGMMLAEYRREVNGTPAGSARLCALENRIDIGDLVFRQVVRHREHSARRSSSNSDLVDGDKMASKLLRAKSAASV